jgi:small subunit ribosomal protein S21
MKENSTNKLTGSTVFVKENENINSALRRFKKKIDDSGLLEELRNREAYVKPSIQRKKAAGAAKARWQKKLREQQLPPKLY